MEQSIVYVDISDLILDFNLYPRTQISPVNVTNLAESISAGFDIPPIKVDRQSKRVVDGFHRVEAFKRLKLEKIPVIFKDYPSEAEMFADAVRCNSTHGKQLSTYDQKRVIAKASELGLEREKICEILRITIDKLERIKGEKAFSPEGKVLPLKRGLEFLRDRKLTKKQEKLIKKWGGMNIKFYLNQLIAYLEAADYSAIDTEFVEKMDYLFELWNKIMQEGESKAN